MGESESTREEHLLLVQLQRSFLKIFTASDEVNRLLCNTRDAVKQLENLFEQYECCNICQDAPILHDKRIRLGGEQLKFRLLCKLRSECDDKVGVLRGEVLAHVEKEVNVIIAQCTLCMKMYERYAQVLGVDGVCRRTSTRHSISDMLESIADLRHHHSNQLALMSASLDRLILDDDDTDPVSGVARGNGVSMFVSVWTPPPLPSSVASSDMDQWASVTDNCRRKYELFCHTKLPSVT